MDLIILLCVCVCCYSVELNAIRKQHQIETDAFGAHSLCAFGFHSIGFHRNVQSERTKWNGETLTLHYNLIFSAHSIKLTNECVRRVQHFRFSQ